MNAQANELAKARVEALDCADELQKAQRRIEELTEYGREADRQLAELRRRHNQLALDYTQAEKLLIEAVGQLRQALDGWEREQSRLTTPADRRDNRSAGAETPHKP